MTIAAAWWRAQDNGQVACDLCPVNCRLREGQTGPCATRANHWITNRGRSVAPP